MSNTGREQSIRLNITVSSGTGQGEIVNRWDLVRRIRVIPVAESNTYAFTITDADNDIIFDSAVIGTITGTFSFANEMSLGIAKYVNISSASADGTYKVKFDMH